MKHNSTHSFGRDGHPHRRQHHPDHDSARFAGGPSWEPGRGSGRGGRGGPFGPGLPGGFGGRRMGRVPRGDLRLTLLRLLAERPMHGYEIMSEIESRTGGIWKPSPGSVYPNLSMLEDEGLVAASTDGTRKIFSLTNEGRAAAPDPSSPPPWAGVVGSADPALGELRSALHSVHKAIEQVMDAGSPEDKAAAAGLLNGLRRELYLILAGTPADDTASSDPGTV